MEKVLVVSYYWPPAGGPGVQRWLKFCKYLPEFGYEPHVYIPQNPAYPIQDKSLESEVNPKIKVIKKRIFEPATFSQLFSKEDTQKLSAGIIPDSSKQSKLQQAMLYVRGNYFIPDARKFWVNPSIKFLKEYITEHKITKLITTGPPHSMHLIGLGLKNKFPDITWIADFRDPWTNIGYHNKLKLTEDSEQKHQDLESEVLSNADKILVTSFQTKEEFTQKTSQPIHVITNGYDERKDENAELDEAFTISHIGSLLSERNPHVFWEVLQECVEENEHFKHFFELQLIGKVSEKVVESIESFGLKQYVKLIGYVSHDEAQKFQQQSQVLLLIEIDSPETQGIIPGKLFEYFSSKRPILAIGPKQWDVNKIMSEVNSGATFDYSQKQEIKAQLMEYFDLFLKGKLASNPINIDKYSRRNLTKHLVDVLNDC